MFGENAAKPENSEYSSRLSMNTRRRPSRSAAIESRFAPTNIPANPDAITSALPMLPSPNSLASTGASTPPRNTS
jgi:hypothetical protein